MTYRLRMLSLKWWLYIFNPDGSEAEPIGPFDTIKEAEAAVPDGYRDADKG